MNLKILNDLFKRVFVLTLPRYPNRRKRLEEQLAGVDVEWFNGLDAQEYTREQLIEIIHERDPDVKIPGWAGPKGLAIWPGQQAILDQVVETGGMCLVLEDDAWFVPDAAERLEEYSHQWLGDPIYGEVDLLFLSRPNPASYPDIYWQNKSDHEPQLDSPHLPGTDTIGRRLVFRQDGAILDHVYGAANERVSACCYALTPVAVKQIRTPKPNWPWFVTYDHTLGGLTEYENAFKHRCFCVTPCVAFPMYVEGEL